MTFLVLLGPAEVHCLKCQKTLCKMCMDELHKLFTGDNHHVVAACDIPDDESRDSDETKAVVDPTFPGGVAMGACAERTLSFVVVSVGKIRLQL